jgi:hypothetical protein
MQKSLIAAMVDKSQRAMDWHQFRWFEMFRSAALAVVLSLAWGSADAALFKFEVPDSTTYIVDWQNWSGPGLTPTSFALSFIVDTRSLISSNILYGEGGMTHYEFTGNGVLSVSFMANGVELWNDPSAIDFIFYADFAGSPGGGGICFCYLQIGDLNLRSSYIGISYGSIDVEQDKLGDDPLGAILLAQSTLWYGSGWYGTGAWGTFLGDGLPAISEIPIPPAVWLFGGALAILGLIRRRTLAA